MKGLIKYLLIIAIVVVIIYVIQCQKNKEKENFCIFGFIGNTCSTPVAETETYKVKSE